MNGVAVLNASYHYALKTIPVIENYQETDNFSKGLELSFFHFIKIHKIVNQTFL
jgi:hypothetical protein